MEAAIAYIRVSDPSQVTDGNSLATQERQVKEYAVSKGYELLRVFIERGESAKTDDRTALQDLLAFCREHRGKIQVVIFPKIDRFARYLEDYISLKGQLRCLGIRVDSVGERIEDNPTGRLMEHMLASFAQFDNEIRAERSRGGAITAAREGRYVAHPPFGYRRVRFNGKVTIEPEPKDSEVVRETFTRLATGQGCAEVRRWLRGQGFPFVRSYFYKIVRNKTYLGLIERYGESNLGVPPFTPIISRTQYEAAQLAIKPKSMPKTYDRDNPEFPLRGTLKCECSHFLTGAWAHGRSRRYAHYRCLWCPKVNHPREIIHRAFCRELRLVSLDTRFFDRLRDLVAKRLEAVERETRLLRERLQVQIRSLEELRRSIVRKSVEGVIPDDLAREQLQETSAQLETTKLRLQSLTATPGDMKEALDFAEGFFTELDERWHEAGISNQKRLQRFVFPEGLTVTRCGDIRTAEKERNPGLDVLVKAKMSSVVHWGHKRPNPVACMKRQRLSATTLAQLTEVFKQALGQFGFGLWERNVDET